MRSTILVDDDLLARAMRLTGLTGRTGLTGHTAVLHAGLELLIARASARRLATLGGTDSKAKAARNR